MDENHCLNLTDRWRPWFKDLFQTITKSYLHKLKQEINILNKFTLIRTKNSPWICFIKYLKRIDLYGNHNRKMCYCDITLRFVSLSCVHSILWFFFLFIPNGIQNCISTRNVSVKAKSCKRKPKRPINMHKNEWKWRSETLYKVWTEKRSKNITLNSQVHFYFVKSLNWKFYFMKNTTRQYEYISKPHWIKLNENNST